MEAGDNLPSQDPLSGAGPLGGQRQHLDHIWYERGD